MKTYVLTLTLICAVGGALLCLLGKSKYEKYIRYLFCLVALLFIVSPLGELMKKDLPVLFGNDGKESSFSTDEFRAALERETEKELKERAAEEIARRLSLKEDDFALDFSVTVEGVTMSAPSASCTLCTVKAVSRREEIRAILKNYAEEIAFTERIY